MYMCLGLKPPRNGFTLHAFHSSLTKVILYFLGGLIDMYMQCIHSLGCHRSCGTPTSGPPETSTSPGWSIGLDRIEIFYCPTLGHVVVEYYEYSSLVIVDILGYILGVIKKCLMVSTE